MATLFKLNLLWNCVNEIDQINVKNMNDLLATIIVSKHAKYDLKKLILSPFISDEECLNTITNGNSVSRLSNIKKLKMSNLRNRCFSIEFRDKYGDQFDNTDYTDNVEQKDIYDTVIQTFEAILSNTYADHIAGYNFIYKLIESSPLRLCKLETKEYDILVELAELVIGSDNTIPVANEIIRIIKHNTCRCDEYNKRYSYTAGFGPASKWYMPVFVTRVYLKMYENAFMQVCSLSRGKHSISDKDVIRNICDFMFPRYPLVGDLMQYVKVLNKKSQCRILDAA